MSFNYVESPTGRAFHASDALVKMACGPYGSGKSCFCSVEVLAKACQQYPDKNGIRHTRVGVIRSTYPELNSTTRKSLLEVLPPGAGTITGGMPPLKGNYIFPLGDGTQVNLELLLLAVKTPDDCSKLLSHNWTFAWINEATSVSPEVFNTVMARVGRFPAEDAGGIRWGGIMMDFNMPTPNSWLDIFMKNPEPNWAVFMQPPAAVQKEASNGTKYYVVNDGTHGFPIAENLRNIGSREEGDPERGSVTDAEWDAYLIRKGLRYYDNQINSNLKSGREDVVMNQYCMMDVPIIEGKPVYQSFNQDRHIAREPIQPLMFHEIIVGLDQSGHHPGAVVLQNQHGKWCVLDELYANEGFENFLHGMLVPLLRTKYSTNPVTVAIDPSNRADDYQMITPKQRLEDVGLKVENDFTNAPKIRIQTVEHMLNQEIGGLLISPSCDLLVRGFIHEYRYRKLRASGTLTSAYTPTPDKTSDACHVHDALQYAALLIHKGVQDNGEILAAVQRIEERRRQLAIIM